MSTLQDPPLFPLSCKNLVTSMLAVPTSMQQLASTGVSNKWQRTVSDNEESSHRSPTPPEALSTKSCQPTISSDKRSTKKRSSNTHPSANSTSAPSASSAPSAPSAASAPASTSQR